MATFNVTFDELEAPPLFYEDYTVSINPVECGGDAQQRNVKFNNNTGDFVVGYNYSNPAGFPAQTLRVLSYQDVMNFVETSSGVANPAPGFTPSQLKNLTTGVLLSFPSDIPISDLSQLGLELNSLELICAPNQENYTTQRSRKLVFQILDSVGTVGPIHQAVFINYSF